MATPQKETAEGLSIFIGTKYGHIPHDKLYPPISFETRLLVRFLGYNGKQTPIFERVDQDLYDASQAVNGEYKTEK